MEDKLRHIDKNFTDQSWAKMQQLLDEEMPLQKKSERRLVWWWFFLAAGLVAGAATFYFMKTDDSPKPKPVEQPVAALENEKNEEVKLTPKPGVVLPTSPIVSEDLNTSYITETTIETSPTLITQNTDNQPITIKENTLPLPIISLAKNEVRHSDETILEAEVPIVIQEELPQLGKLSLFEKVDELPLSLFPAPNLPTPNIDVKLPKQAKLNWSAYTSVFATSKNSGGGFGAGILAGIPVKNSRLSIQTGLGYTYLTQPLVIVYSEPVDDNNSQGGVGIEDIDSTGTPSSPEAINEGFPRISFDGARPEFSSNTNGRRATSKDRLLLHYLQVPFEVKYRRGRWQFFAGANAGILLTSKSDFTSGGILSNSKELGFAFEQNADISSYNVELKNFDLAATGGIGFDISPKVGLDLRYRAGLIDLVESNNESKDFNRFFEAAIRYRIQ